MSFISIYDFKINSELLNNSKSGRIYLFKDKFYLSWSINLVENKFELLSESWSFEEEKRLISFEYWNKVSNPYAGNSLKFREEEKLRKMDSFKKNQEESKFYTSFFSLYNTFSKNIIFYDKFINNNNINFLKIESDLFFKNYKRKDKEISSNLKQLNKKLIEISSYNKVIDSINGNIDYSYYFFNIFLGDEYYTQNFKFLYKSVFNKTLKNINSKFNFLNLNLQKKNYILEWSVPKEYTIKEKGFFFFLKKSKKFYKSSFIQFLDFFKKKFIKIDSISLYKEINNYTDKSYLLRKLLYSSYSGNQNFDWRTYFFLENNAQLDENINFLDDDDLLDMEDSDIEEISSVYYKVFFFKKLYYDYIAIINQHVFKDLSLDELASLNFLFTYNDKYINNFIIKKFKENNNIFIFKSLKNENNLSLELVNEKLISNNFLNLLKDKEDLFKINETLKLIEFNQSSQKEYVYNFLDLLKEQGNIKKQLSYVFFLKKYFSISLFLNLEKIFDSSNLIYHNSSKNLYNYYNLYNEFVLNDFLRQRINKSSFTYENFNSYDLKYKLNKSDSKFSKYSLDFYTKVVKLDGSFSFKNEYSFYNNQKVLFNFLVYIKGILNIIKSL